MIPKASAAGGGHRQGAATLTLRLSATTVAVGRRVDAIEVMIIAVLLRARHLSHYHQDHHPQILAADLEPRSRI